jgi:hypothetical protein
MSASETGTPAIGDMIYDDLTTTTKASCLLWATGTAKPGRIMGAIVAGMVPAAGEYFLAQTGGNAAGMKTNSDDDIAAGDRVSIKSSVVGLDKEITGTTGAALDVYFDVGYAAAADSNTYNTVSVNLTIFDLA